MQRPLIIAVCYSLLYATPLPAAESTATGPAGYIESFTTSDSCTPADYQLIRQGQILPAKNIRFLTHLYANDQLKIKNGTCEMTLRLGEINIVHLNADRLFYTVPEELKQPPTLPKNCWDVLVESVHYLLYGERETPPRTVSIRGPKEELLQTLVIPSLQTAGARLVAGDRALNLLWEGGLPPYRVRMYQGESKSPVLENAKVTTRQIWLAPYSFKEGQTYRIRVESLPESNCKAQLSESQCLATGHFTVVASAQLPAMPLELKQSALTEEQKQTLFVAWLLHPDRQNRVTWGLEAYQRVAAGQDEFSKWVVSHGKW